MRKFNFMYDINVMSIILRGIQFKGQFGELLFCSTARHLCYQLSVKANRSKCYSRYNTQLNDKAPNYQLIVTQIQLYQNGGSLMYILAKNSQMYPDVPNIWRILNLPNNIKKNQLKKHLTYAFPKSTLSTDYKPKSYYSIIRHTTKICIQNAWKAIPKG